MSTSTSTVFALCIIAGLLIISACSSTKGRQDSLDSDADSDGDGVGDTDTDTDTDDSESVYGPEEVVGALDEMRFKANIKMLASFGDRSVGSPSYDSAEAWVTTELENAGYVVKCR